MKLDVNQKLAVNTADGPIMIISCAGSGKTTVILEKICALISKKVDPSHIIAVTFSRAAANEMKQRFKAKTGIDEVGFATIHSICFSILKSYGSTRPDSVLSNDEKNIFIRGAYRTYIKNNENYNDLDFDDFNSEIELYMSQQRVSEYLDNEDKQGISGAYYLIYKEYKKFKKELKKIDFDDMIIDCHYLLKTNEEILNVLKEKYDYYLIDEFQDTNVIQAEIFYMLACKTNNLCVVGDDDQSIYGFRGADSQIFEDFKNRYPSAKIIHLNTNYRSLPFIINGASRLIVNNKIRIPKLFKSNRVGSGSISINENRNVTEEIVTTINSIKSLHSKGVNYNEIGILYRVNSIAAGLITLLENNEIPYYTSNLPDDIHSGMVFRDIVAYYRLSSGYGSNKDLLRILNRPNRYLKTDKLRNFNINLSKNELLQALIKGEQAEKRLSQIIEKIDQLFIDLGNLRILKPADFMDYLIIKMKYKDALNDFATFLNKKEHSWNDEFNTLHEESKKFESFEEWFIEIARKKESRKNELKKNREEGVYLSTFHGAKGLQWENVFIISVNENITPHFKAIELDTSEDNREVEEERRLFYVAMTRAKEKLTISYSKEKSSERSRFLNEI